MKVRIINKDGKIWEFKSVEAAKSHIRKIHFNNYKTIIENGKQIRVYDDRLEQ